MVDFAVKGREMDSQYIKLTFLGDLMCQMQQIKAAKKSSADYERIFEEVRDLWEDSDYVIANLETPVDMGARLSFEEMRFNAPEGFAHAIKAAGIDFVSTANNHILDRGPEGIANTLSALRTFGIETTGTYDSEEKSHQIFMTKFGEKRIAIIACTYDTNTSRKEYVLPERLEWMVDYLHSPTKYECSFPLRVKLLVKRMVPYPVRIILRQLQNHGRRYSGKPQADSFPIEDFDVPKNQVYLRRILGKIRKARSMADIVIVLSHVGGQYNAKPGPWQLKVTDSFVKAGADVVISNHAHTPLRAEMRDGVFCVHGLGNFCFTPGVGFYNDSCQADYSIVLSCIFDKANMKMVKKCFSIVKSVVRPDGFSVVRHVGDADAENVDIICKRVTGSAVHFRVQKEYSL